MKVFHLLNGESTAKVFSKTPIVGDHLVWREDLMTGCVLQYGSSDQDGWLALRSAQLSTAFGIEKASCRAELERQEGRLYDSSAGEVFFWFEHDLFCQINLVYLLDWYQRHSSGGLRLQLPFLGRAILSHLSRFPSIKNGLGNVENLALKLIAGGKNRLSILFPAFVVEHGEYGYGDLHFMETYISCLH